MTARNGATTREAFRQAGLRWTPEPRVIEEPVPVLDEGLPVVRDPAATEQPATPVAIPSTPTAMRLHVDLLHSMALVGFGILLGYGTALLVVFLNGRG